MKNLAILVLAAGKSSRMKSIKQLEKITNKTLLEITLDTAKKVTRKNIFCVLGANAKKIQQKMFDCLGFTKDEAEKQFGFLMNAFEYGAPPHGGIAFGLDRLVAIMGGNEIIRDFIAFPKNNSGRDVMIDSPSSVSADQLKEINLKTTL